MHTIIVGSGMAGITLAREIRKLDKTRELTIVTADDGSYYAKPNLSNAFAGGKTAASLVMSPPEKLRQELDITFHTQCPVARIDAPGHSIVTPDGKLRYDQLVLAVGASQIPLNLAGQSSDIISVNSLYDYSVLRSRLDGKRRVAIIGAGLIGCEFANDLRLGHFDVDLYDLASRPLERLLPKPASNRLHSKLIEIGVGFRLGTSLDAIQRDGDSLVLIDSLGTAERYDVVISSIGLRPNLSLAKTANLATHIGILTDAYLRTTGPDIYALGDCIELDGQYLPYVLPFMHCAKKLALTLSGHPEKIDLPAMPIVIKTPACPTVVAPPVHSNINWHTESDEEGLRALCIDAVSGKLQGFVLQGNHTRERMALTALLPKPEIFRY